MTGAEFDTLRRKLGLSLDETAGLCGGVLRRTANRWVRDLYPVPDDAVQALRDLEAVMRRQVAFVVDQTSDVTTAGPIILWRYLTAEVYDGSDDKSGLPFGAHAMLCAWAADALAAEGIAVDLRWAESMPDGVSSGYSRAGEP